MKLPKYAIENHHFTIIIIIILLIFGINSFLTMPRSEDPRIAVPGANIIILYPGANPIDIENLIIDPIEKTVNEIEDIRYLQSTSGNGLGTISVEFYFGVDPDDKYSEIVEKVNSIRNELPEEILSIDYNKWDVGNVNMLQLALVSDEAEYREMEKSAEELKDSLEKVSGIKRVEVWAYPEQEVRISLDLERLALMNIPFSQVIYAIQSSNADIPGGSIDSMGKKYNIQTSGSYETIEDIKNTIISSNDGNIVYLHNVADVYFSYEDKDYHARFNSEKALFITASQKDDTNIFDIADKTEKIISEFKENLPLTMSLHYVFDQSRSVQDRFDTFFSNLLQGIILVGIIVFLGVGFRASTIVMAAIPISIFIGIGFLDLSGYALEQLSISGLVIVLGILVDNAIVVTENVSRFMEMGLSRKEAAIRGGSQVGWAIVSATATTILAFVPIIMMRNMSGDFIRSMPVTVVFTLTISLIIALTLTPYLSSIILKGGKTEKKSWIQNKLNKFIRTRYRNFLDWCLHHKKPVISLAFTMFTLSILLFTIVGVSFFPKADKPQFLINIYLPVGSSINNTEAAADFVEESLKEIDAVEHYASSIGRGNPRIYYNENSQPEISNFAQIFIQLKDYNTMKSTIDLLRIKTADYPDAHIEVKELEQGPPVEAPIAIKLLIKDLDELSDTAKDIESIFNQTDGLINVYNPLSTKNTDIHININREEAGIYGLNIADIDRTIRASITGLDVSVFRDNTGKNYNIVIYQDRDEKPSIEDLSKVYVTSATGAQIPLLKVATPEFKTSPLQIRHYNMERSVTLTADVLDDYNITEVTKEIIAKIKSYNGNLNFHVSGELESREESFGGMGVAVIIAMVAIFGVLVLQFRSFSQPFIIFSSIPLAFIGSIVALFITGNSFSFTAFVGLTSLVGIVVNDAIILVDYTNQLIREGSNVDDALKEAGQVRFISIILTSSTTIVGLLPLTLQGGTLWAPLGWTIIGGLFTSTVLTLVIVPVLYKIITNMSAGIMQKINNLLATK